MKIIAIPVKSLTEVTRWGKVIKGDMPHSPEGLFFIPLDKKRMHKIPSISGLLGMNNKANLIARTEKGLLWHITGETRGFTLGLDEEIDGAGDTIKCYNLEGYEPPTPDPITPTPEEPVTEEPKQIITEPTPPTPPEPVTVTKEEPDMSKGIMDRIEGDVERVAVTCSKCNHQYETVVYRLPNGDVDTTKTQARCGQKGCKRKNTAYVKEHYPRPTKAGVTKQPKPKEITPEDTEETEDEPEQIQTVSPEITITATPKVNPATAKPPPPQAEAAVKAITRPNKKVTPPPPEDTEVIPPPPIDWDPIGQMVHGFEAEMIKAKYGREITPAQVKALNQMFTIMMNNLTLQHPELLNSGYTPIVLYLMAQGLIVIPLILDEMKKQKEAEIPKEE